MVLIETFKKMYKQAKIEKLEKKLKIHNDDRKNLKNKQLDMLKKIEELKGSE
jgi:hypothetical protein